MKYVYVVHEINVLQSPLTDAGGVTATHRLRCWMHLRVSGLADSDYDRERRWRSECGATCTLRREPYTAVFVGQGWPLGSPLICVFVYCIVSKRAEDLFANPVNPQIRDELQINICLRRMIYYCTELNLVLVRLSHCLFVFN